MALRLKAIYHHKVHLHVQDELAVKTETDGSKLNRVNLLKTEFKIL